MKRFTSICVMCCIHSFIHSSTCLSIYPSIQSLIHSSIYQPIHSIIYSFIHPLVYLSTHPFNHSFIHLSNRSLIHPSTHAPIIHLSIYTAKRVWLFQPISWLPQLHANLPFHTILRCWKVSQYAFLIFSVEMLKCCVHND